ncbi:MAG: glycerophosphodiester phosphodiesterase family protein [Spirochaetales bacterium]|nr:glycerophosphodiester phosphodiesterase family protein [Spirochaetales bacterium]
MVVFAHRGASAYAPQNTIPAFRKALEMGAEGIELDVQLSADGVPVVIHDFVLDKTTDANGFIHRTGWKELQSADAGAWFSREYLGTPVPSLEEVLGLVPGSVTLNIEIKSLSFLEEKTAEIVNDLLKQDRERKVIISSFNHRILKQYQELSPHTPLGILTGSDMIDFPAYVEHSGIKPYSVHPEASYLSEAYVNEARGRGWKVMCYTINSAEQAGLVQQIGADGIFSDYPDLLKKS